MSHVTCHVSRVTCHMSRVTCHVSGSCLNCFSSMVTFMLSLLCPVNWNYVLQVELCFWCLYNLNAHIFYLLVFSLFLLCKDNLFLCTFLLSILAYSTNCKFQILHFFEYSIWNLHVLCLFLLKNRDKLGMISCTFSYPLFAFWGWIFFFFEVLP